MTLSPRELQNQALRLAKLKRNSPNPFEDAARGRDPAAPKSSGGIAEGRKAAPELPVANEHRGAKARSGTLARSLDRGDANPKGGDVVPDTRQPAVGIKADPPETQPKRGRPPKPETEK